MQLSEHLHLSMTFVPDLNVYPFEYSVDENNACNNNEFNCDSANRCIIHCSSISCKNITIYPNPVESDLIIRLESGIYKTTIYNISGQLVLQKDIDGNHQMNLQSLAKGIYILKIRDVESNRVFNKKFIKQ